MGKKRKFVDVFKTIKCSACALLQTDNCQQCSSTPQEPTIVQPAKRSFLQQILRHGFNVQTKSPSASPTTSQNVCQKTNGLLQHFKIAKFKDGSNYIKGKEVEILLSDIPTASVEVHDSATVNLSDSQRSISMTETETIIDDSLSMAPSINLELKNIEGSRPISTCESLPPLKPLFFEVPSSSDPIFIGRNWLFTEIEKILFSPAKHKSRGIAITGNEGTGKTSILLQLVENSCFGRHSSQINRQSKCGPLSLLASKLVAYHFCQVDYKTTCLVPEFIHSIAAQLCQAPQLACYRDFLAENPVVQNSLSKLNCLMNPSEAFIEGILDPLNYLHQLGTIPKTSFFLVIDSLCEAECHKTDDTGDTISTFLAKHILKFPGWLKIIVTTRSTQQDNVSLIPFQNIDLNGDVQSRDLCEYITVRIKQSQAIRTNVSGSSTGGLERFQRYLHKISKGNFLFIKLSLDFIEQGSIQIKSSNFKALPQTLSELFFLECNNRIPTLQAFKKIEPILSTCLAALNPLNLLEIYHSINSMHSADNIPWDEFIDSIQSLSSFLTPRSDGTYMFFHSSFREWLITREENAESLGKNQFLCDTRLGHAAISFRLSRVEAPLCPEKTLELGHHILNAHIYKGIQGQSHQSIASRDLQAFWLASSSQDLSQTLAHNSNIYYTNFKVTRLLLKAGASPNQLTELYRMAPILTVAAAEGKVDLLSNLIEFGADIDAVNLDGDTALHLACEKRQFETVSLLIKNGASLEQLNHESQCAFVKAILNPQFAILSHLFELMDDPSAAIRRALITICLQQCPGFQLDILDNFLKQFSANLDSPDGIYGETPLTAAVRAGRDDVVTVILNRGGNPGAPNLNGFLPLNLAAKEGISSICSCGFIGFQGYCSILKILLLAGCSADITNSSKRPPLIEAVAEGQFKVIDLLVQNGADVNSQDDEGMNALSWACFRGYFEIAQYVLAHGMDPNHADKLGRTPLDLASIFGSEEIAQLLLDHGALLERADLQGVKPFDRAIGSGHLGLVQFFLRCGAKINLTTWTMATGKHDIILLLLNKLLEDGMFLCKSGQLREGIQKFQGALKKIPHVDNTGEMQESFQNLRINLLLQLSRCKKNSKDPIDAVNLVSDSIRLDPNSYKLWLSRSKGYHNIKATSESLGDCSHTIELPSSIEVKKRILNSKENITRDCSRPRSFSPCQFSTNSLKLLKSTTGNGTMKPKASTSNCLSGRKSWAPKI